mmetsp:Transcript_6291/g.13599  ORF Transcript_6291/g.13599 Transcript_6291/m.13599 type:complete len:190 (-) Transcript_6291:226-795(-)
MPTIIDNKMATDGPTNCQKIKTSSPGSLVSTRSKSNRIANMNGRGKGRGRGRNDQNKKSGGKGNKGGGKWKRNTNARLSQCSSSAELLAVDLAIKAKKTAKSDIGTASKIERKKAKEIEDAKAKATRLRTEMAAKERNATESARKWKEAKEKLLATEAIAAGLSVEELREKRDAENEGITLAQLREKNS